MPNSSLIAVAFESKIIIKDIFDLSRNVNFNIEKNMRVLAIAAG